MLNIFQGSGVDPTAWEARLAAIEARVDMLLTLLPPSRLDVIGADLNAIEAKLDRLLTMKMGPPRCGCGKVMYVDAIGELHCDYCEGVPVARTDGVHWEKWGGQPSRRAPINDPNGGRS